MYLLEYNNIYSIHRVVCNIHLNHDHTIINTSITTTNVTNTKPRQLFPQLLHYGSRLVLYLPKITSDSLVNVILNSIEMRYCIMGLAISTPYYYNGRALHYGSS